MWLIANGLKSVTFWIIGWLVSMACPCFTWKLLKTLLPKVSPHFLYGVSAKVRCLAERRDFEGGSRHTTDDKLGFRTWAVGLSPSMRKRLCGCGWAQLRLVCWKQKGSKMCVSLLYENSLFWRSPPVQDSMTAMASYMTLLPCHSTITTTTSHCRAPSVPVVQTKSSGTQLISMHSFGIQSLKWCVPSAQSVTPVFL